MADILANLEAQLEGMDNSSANLDVDTDSSEDDNDDDDDGGYTTSDEEEDSDEDSSSSEEEEEGQPEASHATDDDDAGWSSPAGMNCPTPDESVVTSASAAERRLNQARMDISAQLESEKAKLGDSDKSRLSELKEVTERRRSSIKSMNIGELMMDDGSGNGSIIIVKRNDDEIRPRSRRNSLKDMPQQSHQHNKQPDNEEAAAQAKREEAEAKEAFERKRRKSSKKMEARAAELQAMEDDSKGRKEKSAQPNRHRDDDSAGNSSDEEDSDDVSELSSLRSKENPNLNEEDTDGKDKNDSGSDSDSDSDSSSSDSSSSDLTDSGCSSLAKEKTKKALPKLEPSNTSTKPIILPSNSKCNDFLGSSGRSHHTISAIGLDRSTKSMHIKDLDRSAQSYNARQLLDRSTHSMRSLPSLNRHSASFTRGISKSFDKSGSAYAYAKLRRVQERDQEEVDGDDRVAGKPYHHGRTPFGRATESKPKRKLDERSPKFWRSKDVLFVCALLLAAGAIFGVQLTKYYKQKVLQNDPDWRFQKLADSTLQNTERQMQQITTSLNLLATKLKNETQFSNQTWPFAVSFAVSHDLMLRHVFPLLAKAQNKVIHSIVVAPLITHRNWREFEYFMEDTLYDEQKVARVETASSLLEWDPLLEHYRPENGEAKFVPWQQITRKMNHPKSNSPIFMDWYGGTKSKADAQQRSRIWTSIEQSNTTATPRLLLRNPTSKKSRYDYILHPVIDSVIAKKRLLRPNVMEEQVAVVVAAQVRWEIILKRAFEGALNGTIGEISAGAVASVDDICTGKSLRYHVSAFLDSKVPATKTDLDTAIIPLETRRNQAKTHMELRTAGIDFNELNVVDCAAGTSWRVHLYPTTRLRHLLIEPLWEVYGIIVAWLVALAYVGIFVLFRIQERKQKQSFYRNALRQELENEDLDPDEFFRTATVLALDLDGMNGWSSSYFKEDRPRDLDTLALLASLLEALDQLAAKHKVVKIQSVGGTLLYASGQADNVDHVLRFARDCFWKLSELKIEWESSHGPAVQKIEFTGGLGHGPLQGGHLVAERFAVYQPAATIQGVIELQARAKAGRIYLSKSVADLLSKSGKSDWMHSGNTNSSQTWLDFSSPSPRQAIRRRNSGKSVNLDRSHGNHSLKSFNTRLSARRDRQGKNESNSTIRSLNDSKSLRKHNSLHDHMVQLREQQGPPQPLNKLEANHQPPVSEIDVSISEKFDSDHEEPAATPEAQVDLGYEPMEVDGDDSEDYDDGSSDHYNDEEMNVSFNQKQMVLVLAQQRERLLDWTVDVLARSLEEILAARTTRMSKKALGAVEDQLGKGSNILDQCKDVIQIPIFTRGEIQERAPPGSVPLTDAAARQLRDYVTRIADGYHDMAYHNFEHAANVTASMRKLFNKLVGGELARRGSSNLGIMKDNSGRSLFSSISVGQSSSYGIKTDPLIKFSILFCALIHDVDHPGVENAQLIEENSPMAVVYKKRSITEQNSVEFAWSLLMQPQYVDLRASIYSNEKELRRFRQIIVNCVLATDLHDSRGQLDRKARWAKAFADDSTAVASTQQPRGRRRSENTSKIVEAANEAPSEGPKNSMLMALRRAATTGSNMLTSRPKNDVNRKGTIVLEHLLQAADIAHTMQNWKVFLKWNERLFDEFFEAYEAGRTTVDPASFWYDAELEFFDTIVIPLATKLSSCGVFEDGEDFLENAIANRESWAANGSEVLEVYLAHYQESHVHQHRKQAEHGNNEESYDDLNHSGDGTEVSARRPSSGSLQKHLHSAGPGKMEHDSSGNLSGSMDQSRDGVPGTANSSVDGTITDDEADAANDPDIVFAVLSPDCSPDDFDSYILLTPAQIRRRDREEREKDNRSVGTAERRERRRRLRRNFSMATTNRDAFKNTLRRKTSRPSPSTNTGS